MTFSLKWLLAGSAYGVLAAAALATGHWVYVDLLWAVTFFAVAYATVVALFARGPRQVVAAGFAVASGLLLVCLQLSPDSVPTARLIVIVAKDYPSPAPRLVSALYSATLSPTFDSDGAPILQGGGSIGGSGSGSAFLSGTLNPDPLTWVGAYRAANAVATMLSGLTGALLGVAASPRQGRRD
jgi:hypothetical protein